MVGASGCLLQVQVPSRHRAVALKRGSSLFCESAMLEPIVAMLTLPPPARVMPTRIAATTVLRDLLDHEPRLIANNLAIGW